MEKTCDLETARSLGADAAEKMRAQEKKGFVSVDSDGSKYGLPGITQYEAWLLNETE
ncbi:MAG: hypothetical protein J5940_06960 [Clostridia bacterium]|nr:hypothetical protein [Clostridia bacterium]